jgi:hypothetical protein
MGGADSPTVLTGSRAVQAGEWAWYLSRLTTACTAGLLQGLYLLRSGRRAHRTPPPPRARARGRRAGGSIRNLRLRACSLLRCCMPGWLPIDACMAGCDDAYYVGRSSCDGWLHYLLL